MNCEHVVEEVLLSLKVMIEENRAVIHRDRLPTVRGSHSELLQLFQNLISNAIKFKGDRSPDIEISCSENANEWVFCIKDNGIGFDMQYANRIFAAFQRLNPKDEFPGSGLGLAVCERIARNHGGRIWVESHKGDGSTFYFTLPKQRGRTDS